MGFGKVGRVATAAVLVLVVMIVMAGSANAATSVQINNVAPTLVMPGDTITVNFTFTAQGETVLNGTTTLVDGTSLNNTNPWASGNNTLIFYNTTTTWDPDKNAIYLDVYGDTTDDPTNNTDDDILLAGNASVADTATPSTTNPWSDVAFYDANTTDGGYNWSIDAIVLDVDTDEVYDCIDSFNLNVTVSETTTTIDSYTYTGLTNGSSYTKVETATIPVGILASNNWTTSATVTVADANDPSINNSTTITIGGLSEVKVGTAAFTSPSDTGTIKASTNVPIYVNITSPYKPNWVKVNLTNFGVGVVDLTLNSYNETEGWYNYTATVDPTKASYADFAVEFNVTLSNSNKVTYTQTLQLNVTPNVPAKWIIVESDTNKPSGWGLDSDDNVIWDGKSDYINATIYVAAADEFGNVNDSLSSDGYSGYVSIVSGPGILSETSVFVNDSQPNDSFIVSVPNADATAFVTIEVYGGGLAKATKKIGFYDRIDHLDVKVAKSELYANDSDSTEVYVVLKDSAGNTIPVPDINIVIDELTTLGLTFPPSQNASTNDSGIATFTVKAGVNSGTATIRAIVDSDIAWDGRYGDANVTLKQAPDPDKITAVIPGSITAGEGYKIEFTLVDYAGQPIVSSSEFPVEFNITSGDAVWLENNDRVYVVESTDANGNVSATLYSTNASTTISVVISVKNETGQWAEIANETVDVVPNVVKDMVISPAEAIGLPNIPGTSVTIGVNLTDEFGNFNSTANATMIVTTDNPSLGNMSNGSATVNDNLIVEIKNGVGSFTYTVNSTAEGTAKLTLNVTDFGVVKIVTITTTGPKGVKVYFNKTLPLVGEAISVTAQLTTADGVDIAYQGIDLTLVVRDSNDNIVFVGTGITDSSGSYTWTFVNGTTPGVYTFRVSNATLEISGVNTTTFVGPATKLKVSINKTVPLINDTVAINATVYDANGYVTSWLDDYTVTFLINDVVVGSATFTNGVASITYTFKEAGTYAITAYYNETLQDSVEITVGGAPLPDLMVESITVALESPTVNETVTVTVKIANVGDADAGAFNVSLYANGSLVGTKTVDSLAAGASTTVSFSWTPSEAKVYELKVVADVDKAVDEGNENNNEMAKSVTVATSAEQLKEQLKTEILQLIMDYMENPSEDLKQQILEKIMDYMKLILT